MTMQRSQAIIPEVMPAFKTDKERRAWQRFIKKERNRQTLWKILEFLKDNPWALGLSIVVVVDLLMAAGMITLLKAKAIKALSVALIAAGHGADGTTTAIVSGGAAELDLFEPPAATYSWWEKMVFQDKWPWEN